MLGSAAGEQASVARRRPSWLKRNRRTVGWSSLVVGGLALLGGIAEIADGSAGTSGTWTTLVVCVGLIVWGAWLLLAARRDRLAGLPDPADEPELEPAVAELRVLDLARREAGRLTAAEASVGARLPFETVRGILERLADREACRRTVTEDGVVVYRFYEFEDPTRKRDMLEPPR
jgi:hypothetical protein